MRILERLQAFLHLLNIEIFLFFLLKTFLASRAYLLEPPPRDYITKRKPQKNLKIQMR